jgi:uncharacterized protein YcgI (DUF1989 family)
MLPENFVQNYHLEPQAGVGFKVQQGQVIRVIDVDGEQVSDLVCFADSESKEYLSSARSIDYAERLHLSTGDVLYSNLSNQMLTIIADRVGKHDFLFAPCSQEMFQISYGITEPHPNCLDNLAMNLQPFGIQAFQIPTAFNIFMNATITERGEIIINPPVSQPGDYIDMRAEMDLIVAITACSAGKCNNYHCTPIEVEIYAGEQEVG